MLAVLHARAMVVIGVYAPCFYVRRSYAFSLLCFYAPMLLLCFVASMLCRFYVSMLLCSYVHLQLVMLEFFLHALYSWLVQFLQNASPRMPKSGPPSRAPLGGGTPKRGSRAHSAS